MPIKLTQEIGRGRLSGKRVLITGTAGGQGAAAHRRTVDLSDSLAARDWVDRGVDTLGGLDVLYNNTSATRFASFSEMTREV